jgi:hypothetical protein
MASGPTRVAIDIRKGRRGTEVFIAVHDADLEVNRDDQTQILLYDASVDVYLAGLEREVTLNIYKLGDRKEAERPFRDSGRDYQRPRQERS